jgi:DNA-binding LacI/PurR family transcriptional regulator
MNREKAEGSECVMSDEKANGQIMARHLIELGHEHIGYIVFESPNYQLRDRLIGIRTELEKAGLDTSNILVGPRGCCMVDLAEQILDRKPRVTGVICFHRGAYDAMSHMAMRRGIKVPEELSICYFASPWQVVLSDYRPTVVEVNEAGMGVSAVRRLMQLLKGESLEPAEPVVGNFHLGWTTSRPGEAWAKGVDRCRHEAGQCLYSYRTVNWTK